LVTCTARRPRRWVKRSQGVSPTSARRSACTSSHENTGGGTVRSPTPSVTLAAAATSASNS